METVERNRILSSDFVVLSLSDILAEIGDDGFKEIVSDFFCPFDDDFKKFLDQKACTLERAEYNESRTYLVGYVGSSGKFCVCGYFSLVNQPYELSDELSNSKKKRLLSGKTGRHSISAVLIGQLCKNYAGGRNFLISGSDLVFMALEQIENVYSSIGLNLVYLECADSQKLIEFYEKCGFELLMNKDGNPIVGKSGLCTMIAKYKNIIQVKNKV